VGQSEDHVDIAGGQKVPAARCQPAVARVGLALWAVPVSAGNGEIPITCLGLNRCAVFAWHQHFNTKSPRW
jgi:hypothetical protein